MNKKIILIILSIVLLITTFIWFSSRNNHAIYDTTRVFVKISIEELEQKIENNDDFSLYIYKENCTYSKEFNPILIPYLQEHNQTIFIISSKKERNALEDITQQKFEVTPNIFTFQDGQIVDYISGLPSESMLEDFFNNND